MSGDCVPHIQGLPPRRSAQAAGTVTLWSN